MKGVASVPLGRVATIERQIVEASDIRPGSLYVGLENIVSGGRFVDVRPVNAGELASNKFKFTASHLLYGKLRPYLAKIARPDFDGICSTDIVPVLPGPEIDRGYLAWMLLTPALVAIANSRASGANLPRLSPQSLAALEIPLVPLSEQRRIAEILDKVDALCVKRRSAIAQLDTLTQSIFLEMFGELGRNSTDWPFQPLRCLLAAPLRNGQSPSKGGRITAKVLTLSAITGGAFDSESVKTSTFAVTPPTEQSVYKEDLLICRGNGNLSLVGKGYFALHRMSDVTFPDTIIAARIDRERTDPGFLEHVWNSPLVRRQIESAARTTNGTFKVNQSILEKVLVPSPPIRMQQEFGDRRSAVVSVKTKQFVALSVANALFASLQHRAFRGEL